MAKNPKGNGSKTTVETRETTKDIPGAGQGLLGATGDGSFPSALLKANEDFHTALANSYIRDEVQRNAIVIYASQLKLFDMVDELEDLVNFLNGGLSINMAGRAQGLQAHVGMVFPSISGMKVGKDELKYMGEVNKERAKAKSKDKEDED